ncbi:siderophore-interacting protein [Nocardioides sp. MAH-18]|uniref:Siderophore-interacting protein n=1 Tax=Nocardioides agri TaxID=2682843 RepID=A0A6L6XXH8_9ACTN|nr:MULTISPECIES: siderophore-interacting protein [unclassified Nocardioides]MBA2952932.1 siderophore-interacting protein [Nocardioides sp. CGMCC 1.13656]MVQ52094.1 siderophore-interacting protein [Nocardioides sp. MAH-18]
MPAWHGQVESTEWLTPTLVRVVLGGPGLQGFAVPDDTDTYVNVAIPPAGAAYGGAFSPAEVKDAHPKELWPVRRRYTVRGWDAAAGLLTLDFVVHGDQGVAGPWAARAAAGDVLVFEGPGSGYCPDPEADWHLLVGDESALPAIAASLEAMPAGTRAVVRLVCDGPEHEVPLACAGDLDLGWLHRTGAVDDVDLLADAVADLDWPAGRVQAFVHGEAGEIRAIRRHLLADRRLDRSSMSCSPYWRRETTDEAWRAVKRDFVAEMEADVA